MQQVKTSFNFRLPRLTNQTISDKPRIYKLIIFLTVQNQMTVLCGHAHQEKILKAFVIRMEGMHTDNGRI
jgi:hypothetical protein